MTSVLVDHQLSALYNGVSQQPATLRLPSQAEGQVNCYGTVVDGLRKRPPSEHVAVLSTESLSNAYLHIINRDPVERYVVVLVDGDLKVFDLAGNAKVVAFPHGKDYLDVTDARHDFAVVTVADYSFIVNKSVTVEMDEAGADHVADPDTYWWLNRALAGAVSTSAAQQLAQQIQYQQNPNGTFRGVKQSLQDLPEEPLNGDIWQIQGTEESAFAAYYVIREGAVWNETVKPALVNKIKATTMPHALVRKADGTFEFGPFSWNPRRVGDEKTNPNPTFVGRQIKDVFFYKNRLGFAVDENVVMSRVGDFGTFHRLTVIDNLVDDVIDIGASDVQVTKFNHVVPFDKTMMLFSGQVQFQLYTEQVLTAQGTRESLRPSTRYEMAAGVRPLALGSDVYFGAEDEQWARIYEYFVADNSVSTEAGNVAAHVPRYIPAGLTKLTGSSDNDVLFAVTEGAPNRLYAYKFYWVNEQEKAQSSWSYWEFGKADHVLTAEMIDNYVYVVFEREGGTFLERIGLDSGALAPGLSFQIFLDRRAQVTGIYLPTEDRTVFTLPYPVPTVDRDAFRLVRGVSFAGNVGAVSSLAPSDYTWTDAFNVSVAGNLGGACLAGLNYEKRYTFSKQFMRNNQNVPIVTGRLTMRTFTVYFVDTAYFKTEVAPYGVSPEVEEYVPSRVSEFDGKTVGSATLTLGTPVFETGAYQFTVGGEGDVATITLINDTPYASTFQQAEWEGTFTKRSRTI